jgi:hypothetical protein
MAPLLPILAGVLGAAYLWNQSRASRTTTPEGFTPLDAGQVRISRWLPAALQPVITLPTVPAEPPTVSTVTYNGQQASAVVYRDTDGATITVRYDVAGNLMPAANPARRRNAGPRCSRY